MARQGRTGKNNRTTYVYFDANGRKQIELRPGEDGVTEADISMLHEMDDADLNADRREEYHIPSRYEGFFEENEATNYALLDEESNPENIIIASVDEAEVKKRLEKLSAAMEHLLPAQRDLFTKYYVQKRSFVDIAAEEGVTPSAVRNRLLKMHGRLKKHF